MSQIDVTFFLDSLSGGGAERVMLTLAKEMSRMGFSVEFVLAEARGEYLDQVPDEINVVNLRSPRVVKSLLPLISYLRKQRPKVLLTTQTHVNCLGIVAKYLSFSGVKVYVREANTMSQCVGKHGTFIDRNLPRIAKTLYTFSNGIIAVSGGVKDDLISTIKINKDRITVIYNPTVSDSLLELAQEDVGHPWLQKRDLPVVLGVGRLTKQKDFSNLLCAVSLSKDSRPFRLIVLGEGELRLELERKAEELGICHLVDFPGFNPNPFSYMSKVNVFVLSSLWEGLPNVLIQAMSVGCSVVSTRCPSGPDEIVLDESLGTLVPCADSEALNVAICRAIDAPMSNQAKEKLMQYCSEKYSVSVITKKYLSYLGVGICKESF